VIRHARLIVVVAAALPRLVVLIVERHDILTAFTEKSDDIAQTFVKTGTFGFIPGHPTAWTQPLYAWFLIPIYWIFGRSWWAVGVIQIAVAVGTALLVYELGRRFVSKRVGLVAAVVATLNPYLVWHDVHENREILDQFLAVAVVLLVMILAGRRSLWLAAVLGLALGLAILGNTRLLFLPLIGCAFLVGRERRTWAVVGVVLAGCALTLLPWAVRNRVQVGCFTLTTDTRALWKANNVNTYETLAAGKWIDDVPPLPNEPPTPEFAGAYYKVYGKVLPVDECARMRVYRHLVLEFWRQHPGEKAKLAGQATEMLWNPQAIRTEGRAESGRAVDKLRRWVQPAYSIPLFVLGLLGVWLLPGRLALFGVAVLTYQTLVAIGFAGATRYRVPWDFLIALAGAATVWWEVDRARRRRTVA
jgi:4-amino-4-deoxy-L-arabinose transferase-like glycosyltransferase